ncbi:amidohydrolase family protein [Phenylobacterium sp. VNQ135]|uniref:amidohydrolase family protein n=1 Tax=Phenylobacterium sp. VNQ135 TaxID=3400922 RepID=UPI003C129A30
MVELVEQIRVVDTDTHVIEAYDLWTSRISVAKYGDLVPQVRWDAEAEQEAWYFGGKRIAYAAGSCMAGWHEYAPDRPRKLAEADPACWRAEDRLKKMDETGVYAQILYPNVAGFGAGRYLTLNDPELMLLCVQAYNDWVVEWAGIAPKRLIPQMAIPFWDIQASIAEMDRATKLGHKGIVLCGAPQDFNLPKLSDPYWDPFWAAAQERNLPVNFHIGTGDMWVFDMMHESVGKHASFAAVAPVLFTENIQVIVQLIFGGICHRFPNLKFVSVESGAGWLPFALESFDWQWLNSGVHKEHPEYKLLPSEFFKRQIYGSYWFERKSLHSALDAIGADNIMYETDFPHPTSMSPGPATIATSPREYIQETLGDVPRDVAEKLLWGNAARVYNLD